MGILKKFPSYDFLFRAAAHAIQRFPFTLLSALLGTMAAVVLIGSEPGPDTLGFQRILLAGLLGISLFTAVVALSERRNWTRGTQLGLQAAGAVLLIIYYLVLPANPIGHLGTLVRFALFAITSHLLVAFLPYLSGEGVQGFWQYNKALFLRILVSALFSAVMFAGLAIALAALHFLFGVDVKGETYGRLFAIIGIFFNTWVFLSGIPDNLAALDNVTDYPRGLKIFAQYILLPLVVLYLVILYVYEAKIIIQWNWPKGWVSQLILWFSVVGILSLLLLWPLRQASENKWVRTFANWFFRLLIPLVVMLFFAVLERITEYGLTVNRYLVIAMAVGLALVVLYFVLSRKKDIRAIPMIVCVVALLSALGPWSAFSVSEASQAKRLSTYLTKYELAPGQMTDSLNQKISNDDRNEMSSIVMYLNEWHGTDAFLRWLPDSALASLDTLSRFSGTNDSISHLLGFKFQQPHFVSENGAYFSVAAEQRSITKISGFDFLVPIPSRWAVTPKDSITLAIGNDSLRIRFDWEKTKSMYLAFRDGQSGLVDTVIMPLADTLKKFGGYGGDARVANDSLTFPMASRSFDIELILRMVNGAAFPDSVRVDYLDGFLLLRRR